jgi:hypothetical protein
MKCRSAGAVAIKQAGGGRGGWLSSINASCGVCLGLRPTTRYGVSRSSPRTSPADDGELSCAAADVLDGRSLRRIPTARAGVASAPDSRTQNARHRCNPRNMTQRPADT